MVSLKKKKIADSVIEEIRRMINDGELKVGDKLPNQNEFSAQLGISRISLREALHTLELLGVIEQRPGYGTAIKAMVPVLFSDNLAPPMMSDERATVELIEARKFIEVGVAELAARNASEEQIRELADITGKMKQALKERKEDEYTSLDVQFHFLIAKASGNQVMNYFLTNIREYLEQFIQETFSVLPGLLKRSLKFHVNIYLAIKDRDSKKAVDHMKRHMEDIQRALEQYYEIAKKKA